MKFLPSTRSTGTAAPLGYNLYCYVEKRLSGNALQAEKELPANAAVPFEKLHEGEKHFRRLHRKCTDKM